MHSLAASRASVVLCALLFTACAGLSGKESDLSYAVAEERIIRLTDPVLRMGLGTELDAAESYSRQGLCDDAHGALSDYVRPVVHYRFPVELLEGGPDDFVDEVEDLWRSEGIETTSDSSPAISIAVGVSSDGSSFRVYVDSGTASVFVGGSGPCVEPPE